MLRPELTAAAAHLERRIHVDGTLLRHLENLRADASEDQDPDAVRQLTQAASRLSDAVETLAGLQTDVVTATPRWRDAQAAQAFTAVPATEINPTADVLSALLGGRDLPRGHDLSPVVSQVVLNFTALTDRLTAPSRQAPDPDGRPADTEPLEDTDGVYEQFPEQFHDVAEALRARRIPPGGKARLGDLLGDADELFAHEDVPLVATLAMLVGTRETARRRLRLLLCLDAIAAMRSRSAASNRAPVGLFGLQMTISFVRGVTSRSSASRSMVHARRMAGVPRRSLVSSSSSRAKAGGTSMRNVCRIDYRVAEIGDFAGVTLALMDRYGKAPHPFVCVVTPKLPAPGVTVMADFWFYAG